MDSLPAELVVKIFRFLPPADIYRFRKANRRSAEIVARNGLQCKIPVRIIIDSADSLVWVKLTITYTNCRNLTTTVTLRGDREVIEVPERICKFTESFLSADPSFKTFLGQFLTDVTVIRLVMNKIACNSPLNILGTVLKETSCSVKEILFDGCFPVVFNEFLDIIKKETERPLLLIQNENIISALTILANFGTAYAVFFILDDRKSFRDLVRRIILAWKSVERFVNPAGIVYSGDVRWTEQFLQKELEPGYLSVRAFDGKALQFEKTITNETKLFLKYCVMNF